MQVRFLFERPSAWELVRRVEPAAGPGVGSVCSCAASTTSVPQQLQQSPAGKSLQLTFSRRAQVRIKKGMSVIFATGCMLWQAAHVGGALIVAVSFAFG